jgi:hypothetical protein
VKLQCCSVLDVQQWFVLNIIFHYLYVCDGFETTGTHTLLSLPNPHALTYSGSNVGISCFRIISHKQSKTGIQMCTIENERNSQLQNVSLIVFYIGNRSCRGCIIDQNMLLSSTHTPDDDFAGTHLCRMIHELLYLLVA